MHLPLGVGHWGRGAYPPTVNLVRVARRLWATVSCVLQMNGGWTMVRASVRTACWLLLRAAFVSPA